MKREARELVSLHHQSLMLLASVNGHGGIAVHMEGTITVQTTYSTYSYK